MLQLVWIYYLNIRIRETETRVFCADGDIYFELASYLSVFLLTILQIETTPVM